MTFQEAVWAWVQQIPRGKVVTYGQVAACLGSPRAARAVGTAMAHVTNPKVPWHRVVNSRGGISEGGHLHRPEVQMQRLRREGVKFDAAGCIDLRRFRWDGEGAHVEYWLDTRRL